MNKSVNINRLIAYLKAFEKELGNVDILLSSDPEGNNFYQIADEASLTFGIDETGAKKRLIIYPNELVHDL